MRKISLAIVGAGNLGSRLVKLLAANHTLVRNIFVVSASGVRAIALANDFPDRVVAIAAGGTLPEQVDGLFLCCKPKDFAAGCEAVNSLLAKQTEKSPFICSMLAGVALTSLTKAFPNSPDIIRAMPNLAISYQKSVTGFIGSRDLSEEAKELFEALLARGGFTLLLGSEEAIDAVTAMASSGLAYFAKMAESLAATARNHGFSESEALSLATQTLIGAGTVAEHMELADIRKQVATKGGTTERALAVFEKKNLDEIVSEAVEAAMTRAKELRG